jgi:hypothetical protein
MQVNGMSTLDQVSRFFTQVRPILWAVGVFATIVAYVVWANTRIQDVEANQVIMQQNQKYMATDIQELQAALNLSVAVVNGLGRIRCQETPAAARLAGIPCDRLDAGNSIAPRR